MLSITTRPMTEAERAILARWAHLKRAPLPLRILKVAGWVTLVLLAAAMAGVLSQLVYITLQSQNTAALARVRGELDWHGWRGWQGTLPGAGLVLLGSAVYGIGRLRNRRGKTAYQRAMQQALETDRVEVLLCTASDAVVIEGRGDEQPALFVIPVEERTLLVLEGRSVLDQVMTGRFPCSQFTVVRLPGREEVLTVSADGAPFTPSRTRGPLTPGEHYPDMLLTGRLDDLDALLQKST